MNKHDKFNNAKDANAIHKTIQQFFDGIKNLDADKILEIFHPKSSSLSITQNGVCIEPASNWTKIIEDAKVDSEHIFNEEFTTQLISIDIAGRVASAKTMWKFQSCEIIDYYNLINLDDRWLIVNQVYHTFR